jgi:calcineurin-like phosphoesterase family protein
MKSKQVFLIADMHFGHSKMYDLPFRDKHGHPVRPFQSATEADEAMIERWNAVVRPFDKVYTLGDIAIPMGGLDSVSRLNGDKVLVAGNHDWPFEKKLGLYFRSVRAYWKLDNFVLSHVPIHPSSLRNFDGNIHGHLHSGRVELDDGSIDPRYLCVCVEHINYQPIHWEEVKYRFRKQQEDLST